MVDLLLGCFNLIGDFFKEVQPALPQARWDFLLERMDDL